MRQYGRRQISKGLPGADGIQSEVYRGIVHGSGTGVVVGLRYDDIELRGSKLLIWSGSLRRRNGRCFERVDTRIIRG